MNTEKPKYEIKAYSKGELARMYNVSYSTFRKWTFPIRDRLSPLTSQILTPQQVALVFEFLGEP